MKSTPSRKTKTLLLAFMLTALAGCEFSTNVDYDPDADFAAIKTYAWAEQNHPEISDLMHKRIIQAVDEQLQAKGLSQTQSDPDVYVTYHGDDDERTVIDTTSYGYRYSPRWYHRGGVSAATTQVRTYKQGTLIVDIYRASEKQLIWRGTITGTISDNPQKNAKNISKGTEKLFKEYPPKKKS
jgi:hypothetical protein